MPVTGVEPTSFYLESNSANHYSVENVSFFFLSPLPSSIQLEITYMMETEPYTYTYTKDKI